MPPLRCDLSEAKTFVNRVPGCVARFLGLACILRMSFQFQRAHFNPPEDSATRRAPFLASVGTIVLKLTEHCNRRCSYWPVSIKERLKNRTLPTPTLDLVGRDLGELDFSGSICLNLFNEPTATI